MSCRRSIWAGLAPDRWLGNCWSQGHLPDLEPDTLTKVPISWCGKISVMHSPPWVTFCLSRNFLPLGVVAAQGGRESEGTQENWTHGALYPSQGGVWGRHWLKPPTLLGTIMWHLHELFITGDPGQNMELISLLPSFSTYGLLSSMKSLMLFCLDLKFCVSMRFLRGLHSYC